MSADLSARVHDVNNLLTVILASCDLFLEGENHTAEDRRDIEQIQRAAQRAAELTRQLGLATVDVLNVSNA